jgi:hypothetical protein
MKFYSNIIVSEHTTLSSTLMCLSVTKNRGIIAKLRAIFEVLEKQLWTSFSKTEALLCQAVK